MLNKFWLPFVAGLAALALMLAACAPAAPTESLSPVSPPPPAATEPQPTAPEEGEGSDIATDLPPKVQDLVEQARNDLSERLDIAVDDISLRSVEPVEWRDSSLGCPKPGMNYLQVITPGYRIRLEAGGQLYEYHTDEKNAIYCETTRPAGERMTGEELVTAMAKEDLARRLDVSIQQIEVLSAEYVEWPDASLGCPQPGMMYAQVITPGYRIILSASGENYEYHTSLRGVVFCEG